MLSKEYLAGLLTGVLCLGAGYLFAQPGHLATAGPGEASGNFIIATPPSGENEKLIYVYDVNDPAAPRLTVYAFEKGKEIQLRAHRNCMYDKIFDSYEWGGSALSPEEMKKLGKK